MAKTHTVKTSSDGSTSHSYTTSNKLGSRTTTSSTFRTRNGWQTATTESRTTNSGSVFIILKIVLVIMLCLSLFSLMFGNKVFFGFKMLLESIANVPSANISDFTETIEIPTIEADWGAFGNGIRGFLNICINSLNTVVSFVCYMGLGFVQLFGLLKYFIGLI